jgi:hypothetical protein
MERGGVATRSSRKPHLTNDRFRTAGSRRCAKDVDSVRRSRYNGPRPVDHVTVEVTITCASNVRLRTRRSSAYEFRPAQALRVDRRVLRPPRRGSACRSTSEARCPQDGELALGDLQGQSRRCRSWAAPAPRRPARRSGSGSGRVGADGGRPRLARSARRSGGPATEGPVGQWRWCQQIAATRRAAAVTNPARSECPPRRAGS